MTRNSHAIAYPILAIAAIGLLAASPGASALYMVTPLHVSLSAAEADVGDEIAIDVSPAGDEYEGPTYEGATVKVRYGYDPNESAENPPPTQAGEGSTSNGTAEPENPDQPVSSDDPPAEEPVDPYVYVDIATVTLSEKATASLKWTVPADVDDHNAVVQVLAEDGTLLATTHFAVGDAIPMMYLAMEGAPDDGAPPVTDSPPATNEPPASGDERDAAAKDDAAKPVPALGALGVVAALGAVAIVAARRRS